MASLTPNQVKIIKATVPILVEHGNTITTKMYVDMLEANQELKNIFNNVHQKTGHQPRALAGALHAYAANIDDLGVLSPALELICHKHASLYIRPEHYDVVATHLFRAMKNVLGEAATPDVMDAWSAAYWQLANIMIGKEDTLYKSTHGWDDWKDFKITRKIKESDEISSFYLTPIDTSMKLPDYKPGQYICINVFVDELDGGVWQARQYSLSDAPGKDYLRISVKKEPSIIIGEPRYMAHEGYVSNILHETKMEGDVIKVSHPFGDFYFEEEGQDPDAPVVLISAGVGLTCLMSILNTLIAKKSTRPIAWIQGARNSDSRAFKQEITAVAANHKNVQAIQFSSNPKREDVEGEDFNMKGRVDLDKIDSQIIFADNPKTKYLVCGPTQFMLDVEGKLHKYGVPSERIKMELFGTGGVPRI